MADPLVTLSQLALWTQRAEAELEADPFATELITELSDYARFLAGRPDWVRIGFDDETTFEAPYDVRRAVLMAAKRTYKNPDGEVSNTVGPISSRILDQEAVTGAFTEAELAAIQGYNPGGAPDGLYVITTTRGDDPLPYDEILYVPDDHQINLIPDDSAYPSWDIPMFSPGDPGGEG